MDEIEAKFTLPDAAALQRLQQIDRVAGYTLGPHQVEEMCDTFLDTAGRAILAAGFYCRQREYADRAGVWMTIKSLPRGEEGAVHRREELQLLLPAPMPPAEWPAGAARDRVLAWIGPEPLVPLFSFRQVRTVRPVLHEGQPVAELSLDEVHLAAGRHEETFRELEVELTAQGAEADLAAVVAGLQAAGQEAGGRLLPQGRSKFERALAHLGRKENGLLTPVERAVCRGLARRQDLHGRRARALLAVDEGRTQEEAGRLSGMSERRVRYWQADFREKRLKIFPERVLRPIEVRAKEQENGRRAVLPAPAEPPPAESPTGEPALPEEGPPAISAAPVPGDTAPPVMPSPDVLLPGDTMSQAARKVMALHWRRMRACEPGVRLGQDIEAVHDMRVATRRLRAALRVFGDFLESTEATALFRGLRRAGRLLGVVRDLDVFRAKVQCYLDALPEGERGSLDSLLAAWQARDAQARRELLAYLDGERYARLQLRMENFLREPAAPESLAPGTEPQPQRLQQVVPVTLYQGLAAVRAYDEWLAGPAVPLERYHQLRIASKGLRYTLEFFRDVLGSEAGRLVNRVKALQDHLGDLQDAVVACNLLRDFLTWGTWGRPAGKDAAWPASPILAPGVAAYLAFRQTEIQRLVATFPAVWDAVRGPEFSQLLARSITALL